MASVKSWKEGEPGAPDFPADFEVVTNAVLQVTDIKTNRNKYYAIELHSAGSRFRVYTHYGRTDDLETSPDAGLIRGSVEIEQNNSTHTRLTASWDAARRKLSLQNLSLQISAQGLRILSDIIPESIKQLLDPKFTSVGIDGPEHAPIVMDEPPGRDSTRPSLTSEGTHRIRPGLASLPLDRCISRARSISIGAGPERDDQHHQHQGLTKPRAAQSGKSLHLAHARNGSQSRFSGMSKASSPGTHAQLPGPQAIGVSSMRPVSSSIGAEATAVTPIITALVAAATAIVPRHRPGVMGSVSRTLQDPGRALAGAGASIRQAAEGPKRHGMKHEPDQQDRRDGATHDIPFESHGHERAHRLDDVGDRVPFVDDSEPFRDQGRRHERGRHERDREEQDRQRARRLLVPCDQRRHE